MFDFCVPGADHHARHTVGAHCGRELRTQAAPVIKQVGQGSPGFGLPRASTASGHLCATGDLASRLRHVARLTRALSVFGF